MISYFLAELKKEYECKKVDVGVFDRVIISGSKTHIEAYDVEGIGRVSMVETIGFLRRWKMQSMFLVPYEKDAPVYYYHRHNRKGNDIYKAEVLNTLLEDRALDEFTPVLEKYADIPDAEDKENWYDEIKMDGCVLKRIKKAEEAKNDEMAKAHFAAYMEVLKNAPACGKTRKTNDMQEFIDGMVEWAGIAVLQLFRAYYDKNVAKKLCLEVLFGVK